MLAARPELHTLWEGLRCRYPLDEVTGKLPDVLHAPDCFRPELWRGERRDPVGVG